MREQVLRPPGGRGGWRVCDQKRGKKGRVEDGAPKMIAFGFFDMGGKGGKGRGGDGWRQGKETGDEGEGGGEASC